MMEEAKRRNCIVPGASGTIYRGPFRPKREEVGDDGIGAPTSRTKQTGTRMSCSEYSTSRVFIPAALLYQETIAHMLIYHFNAVEKHHLAELVSEHFEERVSAELRTDTSVNSNLQFYLRYLDNFETSS